MLGCCCAAEVLWLLEIRVECTPAHTNRIKSLHASSGDTAESHVKTVRTDAW